MSSWTYVTGQVTVSPSGSGQHAKTFILNEVLDHLPAVEGSEQDMQWHIVPKFGHNCSSNHDELGQWSNLGLDSWGKHGNHNFEIQDNYIVVLEGSLRDTIYEETYRSFIKWLSRLSKRVYIENILVKISGHDSSWNWKSTILDNAEPWSDVYMGILRESRDCKSYANSWATNWRYNVVPDKIFWPELLINLVPGGNELAHSYDLVTGNAIDESYMRWNSKSSKHTELDPHVLEYLNKFEERYIEMKDYLKYIEAHLESNKDLDEG